jgi:hypothetical protein
MELNDKKLDNLNRAEVGVNYEISKDSSGNFILNMKYDKIKLHSKKGDEESDMDAANAPTSFDPAEKMLGILTEANLAATISPAGEVKSVSGYKEMTDKIIAGFNSSDANEKNIVKARLEKLIEVGVIRKNMGQLFKIFPDSAVHVGDKWKIKSKENAEFNLNAENSYTLKEIKDSIAFIFSETEMASDSATSNIMGYDVMADLKGKQHGEYEVETKTGMLSNAKITADIEGTIQLMGRDVPVNITMSVKINGHKLK